MWGIGLIVLFVIMVLVGKGGGGARYYYVPDGESWQAVYRDRVLERKKHAPNPASKLVMGLGLGALLVAVLLVVL